MSRIIIDGDVFKTVQKTLGLYVRKQYGTDDILNRILYEVKDHICTTVALDGYTMAVLQFAVTLGSNCSFSLPVIKPNKGLFFAEIDTESMSVFQHGLAVTTEYIQPVKGTFTNYTGVLDRVREKLLDKSTVLQNVDCFDPEYIERVGKAFKATGIKHVFEFFAGNNIEASVFTGSNKQYVLTVMVLPIRTDKLKDIRF